MSFLNKKIYKGNDEDPTPLEESVARAFVELEVDKDLSADLRDLYITAAKNIEVSETKVALLIFVPYRLHKRFKKIQSRLIRELEKKFSGKHVCFVAQRTILSKQYKRQKKGALRPRSRTLTAVHNAVMEDIVYPTQIVGKRTRYLADGKDLLTVYLDPKDIKEIDYKLKTFSKVYKRLTNKNVVFAFPIEA
mmetsp:Transcript_14079/g.15738  ORF Transcript_14079/g.15738 Transcript_14079/m.15738 type:complete len:192 (+) Transcript_14079:24-599(+)|eukprot:CAMPEP_0205821924 /NCGR_PEP_ID=MMETSP0206-20130828/10185_1 /ASSEMBLY_ACC=CAM_ASM_000279 /TAXON_ID=36767 /ORGANISM="Euplotes focardii, Strain TN1" /LENGTH=191 /DNA_ID=CAMNT_0053117773 /DNA_START=34 /DNA_END=609 /DNA_ORIENTATION=+